jgi:hypothetical protein
LVAPRNADGKVALRLGGHRMPIVSFF